MVAPRNRAVSREKFSFSWWSCAVHIVCFRLSLINSILVAFEIRTYRHFPKRPYLCSCPQQKWEARCHTTEANHPFSRHCFSYKYYHRKLIFKNHFSSILHAKYVSSELLEFLSNQLLKLLSQAVKRLTINMVISFLFPK